MKTSFRYFVVRALCAVFALVSFGSGEALAQENGWRSWGFGDDREVPVHRGHRHPVHPHSGHHSDWYQTDDCHHPVVCGRCYSNPCRCHGHGGYHEDDRFHDHDGFDHWDDHDDHWDHGDRSGDLKLVKYRQGKHRGDKPKGYHPPEWWKERGYSLKKNTFKDRDGKYRGANSPVLNKERKPSSGDLRLVKYRQGKHRGRKPSGYHSPEWWKKRGYSLKKNTFKNREGEYRGAKSPELNKKRNKKKKKR
ncbi:hypothetical protein [Sulfuriroseicoccus oceanibius]|uniref:Uncharacterized protein n=1 Tax=Sulfuriroseicoccus oceanibius TaxID=2707525 RepID=A0A6B3LC79_9BACT|nr:hypothetical protein [Sulfuriroseicoccus oceanibius]QQL45512.1 hypothetical protein G3M56_002670 [Sulfuriroseicoccus oceanibius]